MLQVSVKLVCGGHHEDILEINNLIFDEEMTTGRLKEIISSENIMVKIAEHNGRVIGFMIYELSKWKYEIKKLAVRSTYHRKGVGRQLVESVTNKLNPERKHRMSVHVPEKNLEAQLFFKALNFECNRIIPKIETEDLLDNEYVFVRHVK